MNDFTHAKFLITRLSALGDCVHTLPIANRIRDAYPAAHITWVVEDRFASVIRHHPSIDRVIDVPRDILRRPIRLAQLAYELRRSKFDFVLDPQSRTRSATIAKISGARCHVGFAGPQGKEWGPWLTPHRIEPIHAHMVDRYLELTSYLGMKETPVRFDLPVVRAAHGRIVNWLEEHHLEVGEYLVLSTFATSPLRRWSPTKLGELISRLRQYTDAKCVLIWHGSEEYSWVQEANAVASNSAILSPASSILELVELIRNSHGVIATDSAPIHLAAAMAVPCLGIYSHTSPRASGPYLQTDSVVNVAALPPTVHETPSGAKVHSLDREIAALLHAVNERFGSRELSLQSIERTSTGSFAA